MDDCAERAKLMSTTTTLVALHLMAAAILFGVCRLAHGAFFCSSGGEKRGFEIAAK